MELSVRPTAGEVPPWWHLELGWLGSGKGEGRWHCVHGFHAPRFIVSIVRRELPQFRGDGAAEAVEVHKQFRYLCDLPQFRRDGSREVVVLQNHLPQPRHPPQLRGQCAGELVVSQLTATARPTPTPQRQRQRSIAPAFKPAPTVPGDAMPAPPWFNAIPQGGGRYLQDTQQVLRQ
jgi:hypothetical protein